MQPIVNPLPGLVTMALCVSDAFHRGVNAIGDADTDLRVPRDEAERKTPPPDTISSTSFPFLLSPSLTFSLSSRPPLLSASLSISALSSRAPGMTNRWLFR